MMQSLLADRFRLVVHREMKEEQVFDLVVAKSGPKLKKAAETLKASDQGLRGGAGQITGIAAPISLLPGLLSQLLGGPVTDKTELTGRYDFTLKWTPDPSEAQTGAENVPPPDPSGPSIYTALQEQLGLRLASTKRQVEVLVIRSGGRKPPRTDLVGNSCNFAARPPVSMSTEIEAQCNQKRS